MTSEQEAELGAAMLKAALAEQRGVGLKKGAHIPANPQKDAGFRKLTIDSITKMAGKGRNITEIARAHNVSRTTVENEIKRHGATLTGLREAGSGNTEKSDKLAAILPLFDDPSVVLTSKDVAETTGLEQGVVARVMTIMRNHGLLKSRNVRDVHQWSRA